MRSSPQTIGKLLSSEDTDSSNLLAKAKALSKLDNFLKNKLDASLAPHIQVGNIKKNQLIIYTDSQARVVRLRYQQEQILDLLKSTREFRFLQSISIRVQPREEKMVKNLPSPVGMNETNANELESLSRDIGPGALGEALQRLSRNVKK